jgi:hypothetical protein
VDTERTVSVALAGYGMTTFGYALLWSFRQDSIQYISLTCGVGIVLISVLNIKNKNEQFSFRKYKTIVIIIIVIINFLSLVSLSL